jgi:hypothetical protein
MAEGEDKVVRAIGFASAGRVRVWWGVGQQACVSWTDPIGPFPCRVGAFFESELEAVGPYVGQISRFYFVTSLSRETILSAKSTV